MTRKPQKRRPPKSRDPERLERFASRPADGLALGTAAQVPKPYALLAVCGLLALAVIAVFGQTARFDFVNFDDGTYIYKNRHVSGGLTGEGIAWAITAYRSGNWHPLTWLSHMLDCRLYGLKPGAHHLTNVLLHAAAAILLLLALRRMTGALWPSAWVAAVFAIHPLRVESVAWVAERKDVLSGVLFMATLWFYARYAERPASWGRYLLVVAAFALGLTAKPMLVTLPLVLLLLDYWPLGRLFVGWVDGHRRAELVGEPHQERFGRSPSRAAQPQGPLKTPLVPDGTPIAELSVPPVVPPVRLIVEKLPLFVLAAASCAVTLAAQREGVQSLEQLPFPWRVANAAVAYVAYLGKTLCPTGLAVLYPLPKDPPPVLEAIAAIAVLGAISTAVFVVRRKCPYLLVGWLWYSGMLVPVIGLVQVGAQAMADRYTYLPQIGLYAAIAWGAAHVAGAWPYRRWGVAAVASLVVAGLIACSWQQTRYWRDSETLWTHTLACTAQNPIAHNNLGLALADRGQLDEAIDHYRKALKINPNHVEAYNNLGLALADRGQFDEAVDHYRQALEIKPDFVEAHNNLATTLAGSGKIDDAVAEYRKAIEIKPDYADAHFNLGNVLARCARFDEAMDHYRKALEIDPGFVEARNNLATTLARRGRIDEAIAEYRKALEARPDDVKAHNNLGNALAGRGKLDEAIVHYRRALEIDPDYVSAHVNLGNALADRGQLDEAMEHYRKALDLAIARNDKARAEAIRARIRLHESAAPGGHSP